MENRDFKELEECECDSCSAPVMVNCQSCGMPMTSREDFGGGDPGNVYCVNCCYPDGSLKSYEETLEGITAFMMKMRGMDKKMAAEAAREYMAGMPAWNGR